MCFFPIQSLIFTAEKVGFKGEYIARTCFHEAEIDSEIERKSVGIISFLVRGMAEKFVDTISIFNRKRNSVKMNISDFAKIFREQIDEILGKSGQHDIFYSLLCAPS